MSHLNKWETRGWLFAFVVIFMCYAEKFQEDGRAYFAAVDRIETIARESNVAVLDVRDSYKADRDHVRVAAENSAVLARKIEEALALARALQMHVTTIEDEMRPRVHNALTQIESFLEELERSASRFDGAQEDLARIAAFTERVEAILQPLEALMRPFRKEETK